MPITFELAKQLKQNGFPQKDDIFDLYYPPLNELISACKEFFYRLEREGDKWSAIAKIPENKMCSSCPKGITVVVEEGENPETAVANLYLRLKRW